MKKLTKLEKKLLKYALAQVVREFKDEITAKTAKAITKKLYV